MQTTRIINNNEEFSLRDKENLIELEVIIDELIIEMNSDIKIFILIFKNLPLNIYNKIDSLRFMSTDKKGEDFIRVANKAKIVSKKFHNQFK